MELLLHSQTGELILLPSLPSEWKDGAVEGIRGRGGFRVDMNWSAGELTQVTIESQLGEPGAVRYGDKVVKLDMKKGEKATLDRNLRILK